MENTKDFIIDEAFKLFLERSYEAVSISDISKAIGFTKGALYHHFKNKEDLFFSVVDKYLIMPEVIADLESITVYDFLEISNQQSEKVIRKLFDKTLNYSPINYMSFFADAFRHYPAFAESKGHLINHEIEKLEIVLLHAVQSGEIRDDINPDLIAANFFSINMGMAGNLVRNISLDESIQLLKDQTKEFYKLLKKL